MQRRLSMPSFEAFMVDSSSEFENVRQMPNRSDSPENGDKNLRPRDQNPTSSTIFKPKAEPERQRSPGSNSAMPYELILPSGRQHSRAPFDDGQKPSFDPQRQGGRPMRRRASISETIMRLAVIPPDEQVKEPLQQKNASFEVTKAPEVQHMNGFSELLRKELATTVASLRESQKESANLRLSLRDVESENQELINDMQDVLKENEDVHEELRQLKELYSTLQEKTARMEDDRDTLVEKMCTMERAPANMDELADELEMEKEKHRATINRLQKEKALAEGFIEQLSREKDELHKKFAGVINERNSLEQRVVDQALVIADMQNLANDLTRHSQNSDANPGPADGPNKETSGGGGSSRGVNESLLAEMQSRTSILSFSCNERTASGAAMNRQRRSSVIGSAPMGDIYDDASVDSGVQTVGPVMQKASTHPRPHVRMSRRSSWCQGLTEKIADLSNYVSDNGQAQANS